MKQHENEMDTQSSFAASLIILNSKLPLKLKVAFDIHLSTYQNANLRILHIQLYWRRLNHTKYLIHRSYSKTDDSIQ